jgi:hypothetical protein
LQIKIFFLRNFFKWFVSYDRYVYLLLKAKKIRSVNLYGAGYAGVEVFLYLQNKGLEIEEWYDIQANKKEYSVLGQQIKPTTRMKGKAENCIVVLCSVDCEQSMFQECLSQSLVDKQIISWSK